MYDIRLVKLVNGEMVLGKWDQEAGMIHLLLPQYDYHLFQYISSIED